MKPGYTKSTYTKTRNLMWFFGGGICLFALIWVISEIPKTSNAPDIGQNAQLFSADGKDTFIAVSEAAYKAKIDAIYAGDQQGIINLMIACQLFPAPNATPVLIIDRSFNKRKVRITSGELKGLSGWVENEFVK